MKYGGLNTQKGLGGILYYNYNSGGTGMLIVRLRVYHGFVHNRIGREFHDCEPVTQQSDKSNPAL